MLRFAAVLALGLAIGLVPASIRGQAPARSGDPVATLPQVKAALDRLGDLDFTTRMTAGRTIRRAPVATAVPALMEAVAEHKDSYVRFRALVLLSGFNDPRTRDVMLSALGDPNDRLRTVAYAYFEHAPDPSVLPRLLAAADKEVTEFVRPALMRALAAHGSDARVRDTMSALVLKGQDLFRGAVIAALGDHGGAYATARITEVARLEGPLQDDAVIALGKIGDKASLAVFAGLQRNAPRETQPAIAAAICMLGVNCPSHTNFLVKTMQFATANADFPELLRAASASLAALAVKGHEQAAGILIEHGAPARDPARAAIALALGTVALRNTPLLIKLLERQPDPGPAVELLRDAFDMLEEDFEEERFFGTVRRTYWQAPEGSPTRTVTNALIQKLEF
jgi:HEAT repeat protein